MKNIPLTGFVPGKINNILLAEDDEEDFYIFNQALSSILGYVRILRTSDGVMFSSIIQTFVPDVFFIDINMPYKNGIVCLKEIRSNGAFNKTKVIMYSTGNKQEEIECCYQLGADFYLVKPTNFSLVKLQLKNLLNNEYFTAKGQTPRDAFVQDYTNEGNKALQSLLVA